MKSIFLFGLQLLAGSCACAGWISTGGDSYRDAHNPWFVRNISTVQYCVELDPLSVSVTQTKATELVQKALLHWQEEFQVMNSLKMAGWEMGVGSQVFHLQPCDGTEDIHFQFGYKTLSSQQISYFQETMQLPQIIARAVRTEYNPVTLKGKGFVYIAADQGAHQYDISANLVPQAWRYEVLLFKVLLHETGHIFGVPHIGQGVMSETYMEELLDLRAYQKHAKSMKVVPFFLPPSSSTNCFLPARSRQWFGIEHPENCLRMEFDHRSGQALFYEESRNHEAKTEIGSMKAQEEWTPDDGNLVAARVIKLWISREQTVFSQQETKGKSILLGPTFFEVSGPSTYVTAKGGEHKPAFFQLAPGRIRILGSIDGKIRKVFETESVNEARP